MKTKTVYKREKFKKNMAKFKQRILILILAISMLGTVFIAGGCGYEQLTNEQHIERISQIVQERFFADDSDYPLEDFTVTILYSLAGYPDFFMVEFEPYGAFMGIVFRNEYYAFGNSVTIISGHRSELYTLGLENEKIYVYLHSKTRFEHFMRKTEDFFICARNPNLRIRTTSTQRPHRNELGSRIDDVAINWEL